MKGKRARIYTFDADYVIGFKIIAKGSFRAPVTEYLRIFLYDEAFDKRLAALDILFVYAIIAYQRITIWPL